MLFVTVGLIVFAVVMLVLLPNSKSKGGLFKLVGFIVLAGVILVLLATFIGEWVALIAYSLLVGGLFYGLYIQRDIHKRIMMITPKPDQVKDAMQTYLKERDEQENKELEEK